MLSDPDEKVTTPPDPMIQVLVDTCFISPETAAWMLEKLSQKGYAVKRKPYHDDFETHFFHLPMACMCDYPGRQELSDLIDELLGTYNEKWVTAHYVPELLSDQVLAEFCLLFSGCVEIYGDQWFGVKVTIDKYTEQQKFIYSIECDSPLHGLLSIWKAAKANGHLVEH